VIRVREGECAREGERERERERLESRTGNAKLKNSGSANYALDLAQSMITPVCVCR
jgi:hypothetical protein